jgi:secreted trypsin-like serine protease
VVPAAHLEGDARQVDIKPPDDLADNSDEAIVRLVADVTCTGTLIADDLVLTAHHCVVKHDIQGHATRIEVKPSEINVELGTTPLAWGEVGVRAIVAPDCGYASGDGDIAVLVLSRRLVGVATITPSEIAPRVALPDDPSIPAESIEAHGYGKCAADTSGVVELARRPGRGIEMVTAGSFYGVAAICRGDSGGPAFLVKKGTKGKAREPHLVGVTSASVMAADDPATGFSVFTRIDAWPELFNAARQIADGASPGEVTASYRSCEREPHKQAKHK